MQGRSSNFEEAPRDINFIPQSFSMFPLNEEIPQKVKEKFKEFQIQKFRM
jgi:hypothetical protein